MKTAESTKSQLETQLKTEKDKLDEATKDLENLRREKSKVDGNLSSLEKELTAERQKAVDIKEDLEKEIANLKRKSLSNDPSTHKIQELSKKNDGMLIH